MAKKRTDCVVLKGIHTKEEKKTDFSFTSTCVHVPHTCSGYVNLVHSYRYTRAHTLLSYVRAHSTIEMMYANKL